MGKRKRFTSIRGLTSKKHIGGQRHTVVAAGGHVKPSLTKIPKVPAEHLDLEEE